MKSKLLIKIIMVAFVVISFVAKADEGMWLPLLVERLNYVDMQKMGCQLTPEEIYSINKASIKDAIVMINSGYCSGEMISNEGLLLTNHHCAISAIQAHSAVDKDYLKDGYWAMSKNEELKNDKFSASFLIRMEDVSQKVLMQLNSSMTEADRETKIQEISSKIESDATQDTPYNAKVLGFFEGNEYYLFIYETYNDVRLVGTPPTNLALFANTTDNWNWPRHSVDFSLFRVYMSPKGGPADYNKKNVPYKPKHFLPISLKGVKKDDFTFAYGYPGTTDRFMTSYGLNLLLEQVNPAIVKIRNEKLTILKSYMDQGEQQRIKYASKYFISDNYRKYFMGQMQVLKRLKAFEKKKELEAKFEQWYNSNPQLKTKYEGVLAEISSAYEEVKKYNLSKYYFREIIERGPEILGYAHTYDALYNALKSGGPENDKLYQITTTLKYDATKYFRDYDRNTDKKIFAVLLNMYYMDVPKDQQPEALKTVDKKYGANFNNFADEVFEKTIFASKDNILNFLSNPDAKAIERDPVYKLMTSFYDKNKEILEILKYSNQQLARANRLFIEGLREMQKDKTFYPNANSTMRLTYGKVSDYNPPSGKVYNFCSTLDEMIQKENPARPDFIVDPKLKDLYNKKDYGRYAENGTMKLNFITNNDVTGGVSGAPVINGKGELVGLIFDINWEATSVSIAFDPEMQRSINIDIRFVMFMIEKYAGAGYLMKEMKFAEK